VQYVVLCREITRKNKNFGKHREDRATENTEKAPLKMAKTKISVRQKASTKSIQNKKPSRKLKPGLGTEVYNPTKALQDEERIGRAIWECLKDGDSEGVIEVIRIHLEACNKSQISKETKLPKTTLYHSLRRKNPTIRTLAKLVHACF
jgi:DNA-binding phage protein